jgi:hypothetical protein
VYLKYKSFKDPLALSIRGTITEPTAVLEPAEIAALLALARAMGTDFAELDVIRHHADQRIYVLDVNNTPSLRFVGVTSRDRQSIIDRLAVAFDEVFLGANAGSVVRRVVPG